MSFGISQRKITSRPKTIQYDQGCPTAQDTGEESSLKTDYSVSSLVVPKMEDEFSGTDAGKNSK